jgi:hypothetical protein
VIELVHMLRPDHETNKTFGTTRSHILIYAMGEDLPHW